MAIVHTQSLAHTHGITGFNVCVTAQVHRASPTTQGTCTQPTSSHLVCTHSPHESHCSIASLSSAPSSVHSGQDVDSIFHKLHWIRDVPTKTRPKPKACVQQMVLFSSRCSSPLHLFSAVLLFLSSVHSDSRKATLSLSRNTCSEIAAPRAAAPAAIASSSLRPSSKPSSRQGAHLA